MKREVGGGKFDAVVFAGPKVLLEENVPAEDLKQMGQVDSPMFYMNYILDPQRGSLAGRHRQRGEVF